MHMMIIMMKTHVDCGVIAIQDHFEYSRWNKYML